ncbi:MAG: tRNA (N(6)-L-threonylcarbamoyladenosine(37)-C(2))-methylthiotransferase MtaB [Lachnospiraceae bacterium]|nr:tRNA (N(6)-L-threonylcarbamoyladenosine(37)-C(2))-methylthiotransferase MtaB [Lachnospiraceae bacterium]
MKKVAFRNLGCKVNEYEMEYMQQRMVDSGYLIVPFDTKSDIYVINTCTVTNIADRKSRQMIHKARKTNPDAIVVAAGCYVQTDEEGALKDGVADIIIGNNNKSRLPEIIEEYIKEHDKALSYVDDLTDCSQYEDMSINISAVHTRAFIKIQDGCNQFCSFCAIPIARGRIRSKKKEEIIKEVTKIANSGCSEIVITGIHLSSYGIDFHPDKDGRIKSYNEAAKDGTFVNNDLLDVIKECAGIEGIKRIRLGSLEPRLITDEFLSELSKTEKVCPHFHLSLQSGCDETLKRMNRKYTVEEYYHAVELLRKYYDEPAITTDVIVGFPGETDEEFEETRKFIQKTGFFELHVFKYSRRDKTVAASMKGQIPDAVKQKRSEILISLGEELSKEFCKKYKGRIVEVLFEEKKNGMYQGHTREYIPVRKASDTDLSGSIDNLSFDGNYCKI